MKGKAAKLHWLESPRPVEFTAKKMTALCGSDVVNPVAAAAGEEARDLEAFRNNPRGCVLCKRLIPTEKYQYWIANAQALLIGEDAA